MRIIQTFLLALTAISAHADTTINATNNFAYGANIGWIQTRGDVSHGLKVGQYYCAGYLYGANVGWINMGNGSPVNGYAYANTSATDFGINTDQLGNLRGYAWGANIGWINFESQGGAKVDLRTGQLSGYCYSANCGWISLSNTCAKAVTDTLWPGQMEKGMPIAWQILNFDAAGASPMDDPDEDGMSNLDEYLAGTGPMSSRDVLRIIDMSKGRGSVTLTWQSVLNRNYFIQYADSLNGPWLNSTIKPIVPESAITSGEVGVGENARFFRVQAVPTL